MNRFGIVGCGSIGRRHIAVLDAENRAELITICDEDAAALAAQSELYPHLATYSNYAEMLTQGGFDVVCIATPHELHTEMAMQAMEAGYHVLVEKPMALNAADCERMNACANRTGKHLWVVKQNRHMNQRVQQQQW